ncbi:MAG: hypothetical protein PF508_02840 [Spirochaeta sp.]|jgi:hypothetical protein|nr:hypothetical protein [Spirochaeta sp.]
MSPQKVAEILTPFRRRLLRTLLRVALVVSIPALVAGVYASIQGHSLFLVVVDIGAYLALVVAYRLPRRRYVAAAHITVATVLLMALTFLFLLGTEGATAVWLTTATLLAAILLERWETVGVFLVSVLALVVATVLLYNDRLPWNIAMYGWISVTTSFLGVAAFSAVAVRYLAERLAQSVINEQILNQEIHHRVRNNLQMMESLLSIEASAGVEAETRETLYLMMDRISAVAHSFDNLRSGSAGLNVYTAGLLDGLSVAQQQRGRPPVSITTSTIPETIGLDDAVPLAIALAELLSHCNVPHAQLAVFAETIDNSVQFTLRDRSNHPLHTASITPIQREIIAALASQFDGTVNLPDPEQSADAVTITVPIAQPITTTGA